jgi:hypothetical protein
MMARAGFKPSTPEPKVSISSTELAAQRYQEPPADVRNGLEVDKANADDLPQKQETAYRRPLPCMRCNVLFTVERETGIEPATTCLEGRRSPLNTGLIVNPVDSKIGVKPG